MSDNNNIFQKVSDYLLERKALKMVRKKSAYNFQTAKTSLILIDGLAKNNDKEINKFITFLKEKNIDCSLIFFYNNKEVVEVEQGSRVFLFSKKNLNWLGNPNHNVINVLLQKEYDLLFDFSKKKYFFFKYIAIISKAKFKIGLFSDSCQYYDFMINLGDNIEIKKFIEDVKHYLSNLNL